MAINLKVYESGQWVLKKNLSEVDWSNVTNKPTTFTPTAHNHNYLPLSGGTISGDLNLYAENTDKFVKFDYNGTMAYSWRIGYLGTGSGNANYLVFQSGKAAGSQYFNALKFGLETLKGDFSIVPSVAGVDVVLTNDVRMTNSRPASDVYSWAKAETRPTYNQDDVSDGTTYKRVTQTEKNTWNAKTTLALGETSSTAYRGDRGKTAYDHSLLTHAPSNAQKNSDITKTEIEAKLTGAITSHTHAYVPTTRKVNGKALSADITLGGTDIEYAGGSGALLTNGEDIDTSLGILQTAVGGKLGTSGTAYNSTRWGSYQIRVGSYTSGSSGYITFSTT